MPIMFILKYEGFIIDAETFGVFQVDFDHNSQKPMYDKHSGTGFGFHHGLKFQE